MDANPGYALAAAILRRLDHRELPALTGVWRAHERRPVRPEQLPPQDRPSGGRAAWAPLVVAFLRTTVLSAPSRDGTGDDHRGSSTPPLAFSGADLERIRRDAAATALGLGESAAGSTRFADAVIGGLSRLPPPAGGS